MSNIEFANIFIQTFITKIKEDKLDTKEIKYWGFFGDPCVHKHRKIGIYGYIEFTNDMIIASSLDKDMDDFELDIAGKNYVKYIEETIIVVANKLFVDFLQADA